MLDKELISEPAKTALGIALLTALSATWLMAGGLHHSVMAQAASPASSKVIVDYSVLDGLGLSSSYAAPVFSPSLPAGIGIISEAPSSPGYVSAPASSGQIIQDPSGRRYVLVPLAQPPVAGQNYLAARPQTPPLRPVMANPLPARQDAVPAELPRSAPVTPVVVEAAPPVPALLFPQGDANPAVSASFAPPAEEENTPDAAAPIADPALEAMLTPPLPTLETLPAKPEASHEEVADAASEGVSENGSDLSPPQTVSNGGVSSVAAAANAMLAASSFASAEPAAPNGPQTPEMTPPKEPEDISAADDPAADSRTAALASLSSTGAVRITYEDNVSKLTAADQSILNTVAARMQEQPDVKMEILAYAGIAEDSNEARARRLSMSRAIEVRKYLLEQGIDIQRLFVRALGYQEGTEPHDRVDIQPLS